MATVVAAYSDCVFSLTVRSWRTTVELTSRTPAATATQGNQPRKGGRTGSLPGFASVIGSGAAATAKLSTSLHSAQRARCSVARPRSRSVRVRSANAVNTSSSRCGSADLPLASSL